MWERLGRDLGVGVTVAIVAVENTAKTFWTIMFCDENGDLLIGLLKWAREETKSKRETSFIMGTAKRELCFMYNYKY